MYNYFFFFYTKKVKKKIVREGKPIKSNTESTKQFKIKGTVYTKMRRVAVFCHDTE